MREKLTLYLIMSFIIFIMLLSIMNGSLYVSSQNVFSAIPNNILIMGISFLLIAELIVNGFLIRSLLQLVGKEAELNSQAAFSESIDELFRAMKSQRHDFGNHVQTLYGMLVQNMNDAAKEYISDIFKETRQLNEMIIVDQPAIAALLKAKHSKAVLNNINFQINIECKLSALTVKAHDLVKILGNVIDNAFDEAISYPVKERLVSLKIYRQGLKAHFEIINPGKIPEGMHLFEPGVSGKEGHQGVGLYTVKKIISSYRGKIELQNAGNIVLCTIILPFRGVHGNEAIS